MTFCLIKPLAEKMKQMVKSGEIDIEKIAEMSSKERRDYFTKTFGERNAKEINALFESKLLLKNQKRGMINWVKQITGIKPEEKRTLIDRINRLKEVLTPENEQRFLEDLVSKRLGTDISFAESKKIAELSENITKLENYTTDAERIASGS